LNTRIMPQYQHKSKHFSQFDGGYQVVYIGYPAHLITELCQHASFGVLPSRLENCGGNVQYVAPTFLNYQMGLKPLIFRCPLIQDTRSPDFNVLPWLPLHIEGRKDDLLPVTADITRPRSCSISILGMSCNQ